MSEGVVALGALVENCRALVRASRLGSVEPQLVMIALGAVLLCGGFVPAASALVSVVEVLILLEPLLALAYDDLGAEGLADELLHGVDRVTAVTGDLREEGLEVDELATVVAEVCGDALLLYFQCLCLHFLRIQEKERESNVRVFNYRLQKILLIEKHLQLLRCDFKLFNQNIVNIYAVLKINTSQCSKQGMEQRLCVDQKHSEHLCASSNCKVPNAFLCGDADCQCKVNHRGHLSIKFTEVHKKAQLIIEKQNEKIEPIKKMLTDYFEAARKQILIDMEETQMALPSLISGSQIRETINAFSVAPESITGFKVSEIVSFGLESPMVFITQGKVQQLIESLNEKMEQFENKIEECLNSQPSLELPKVCSGTVLQGIRQMLEKKGINNPLFEKLYSWDKKPGFEEFYQKCKGKPNTIVFIKVKNSDKIIGGYTPVPWEPVQGFPKRPDPEKKTFIFMGSQKGLEEFNFIKDQFYESVANCHVGEGPEFGYLRKGFYIRKKHGSPLEQECVWNPLGFKNNTNPSNNGVYKKEDFQIENWEVHRVYKNNEKFNYSDIRMSAPNNSQSSRILVLKRKNSAPVPKPVTGLSAIEELPQHSRISNGRQAMPQNQRYPPVEQKQLAKVSEQVQIEDVQFKIDPAQKKQHQIKYSNVDQPRKLQEPVFNSEFRDSIPSGDKFLKIQDKYKPLSIHQSKIKQSQNCCTPQ